MADLILKSNNLYRNGRVYVLTDGEELLLRDIAVFPSTLTDKYHRLRASDTLDYLAWVYYKDLTQDPSKFWHVLADANNVHNPMELEDYVGTDFLIPNIVKAELRI